MIGHLLAPLKRMQGENENKHLKLLESWDLRYILYESLLHRSIPKELSSDASSETVQE